MMTLNKDIWGAFTATICLIHCAAVPILLAMGITVSSGVFFGNEKIHLFLLVPMVVLAVLSFPAGFKKHRNPQPLVMGMLGLVLMLIGLAFEQVELYFTTAASLFLITAHLTNQFKVNAANR